MSARGRSLPWRCAASALSVPILVVAVLCSAAPATGVDDELPLDTEIVSATVYGHQAQIVRSGEVILQAGSVRLVCDDLPEKFIETSLSVEGSGLHGARIIGIDLRRMEEGGPDSPRYLELSEELEQLQAEREQLRITQRALERRKELTAAVGELSADRGREKLGDGSFSIKDWEAVLDFFEGQDVDTDRRLVDVISEATELDNKIVWVSSELRAMKAGTGRGREVVVDCEITAPGTMTLDLTYLVPDASWHPEYTARYMERDDEIELTYAARITQATGEDWKGVDVLLSTASPHVGAAPPALLPHYLGSTTGTLRGRVTDSDTGRPLAWANVSVLGTPHGATTNREGTFVISDVRRGSYTVQAAFLGYKLAKRRNVGVVPGRIERVDFALEAVTITVEETVVEASRPISTQPGVAMHEGEIHVRGGRASEVKQYVDGTPIAAHVEMEVVASEFAANLVIPKPLDLETGAEPKRALVVRERIPGVFVLQAVPRLSDHVFVKGTLENPLEIPLLPGSVQVYVQTVPVEGSAEVSNFVGQEGLPAVAAGQEFTMHLGVDQNVKVEHELRKKEILTKSKSKTTRVRYQYAIVAESFKREPVELWVVDRIPVSTMKDIEIDDVEIGPEPDEMGEDGIVTWKLTLGPGQRQELLTEYVVKFPSQLSLRDLGFEE